MKDKREDFLARLEYARPINERNAMMGEVTLLTLGDSHFKHWDAPDEEGWDEEEKGALDE